MGFGRWLRNKGGFAVSEFAILQRWDDIGGPKGVEKWSLQSKQHFLAARLANMALVPFGMLVPALILPIPARRLAVMAGGALIGGLIAGFLTIDRLWERHNALYQRWLREQTRSTASQERPLSGQEHPTR